uniref:FIT family protein n=1 Tax=Meloidogyne incognita TaxID=6306 RepID=A0A914KGQ4_MELIC
MQYSQRNKGTLRKRQPNVSNDLSNKTNDITINSFHQTKTFLEDFLTNLANYYLFIDVTKKVIAYLILLSILSIIAEFVELPRDLYIVQKHNVFNRFGTKIGWFWTCLLLCPFMWITSLIHNESYLKAFYSQIRLLIATIGWYLWTNAFVKFEDQTGVCQGLNNSSKIDCYNGGGKWIPGFDVSGHTFLLLYSILIVSEESFSFKNLPSKPQLISKNLPTNQQIKRFEQIRKFVERNFICLFLLHLLWDFQLIVTALYYHNFLQKLVGAAIAVGCWAVTYRFWFVVGFPFLPMRRNV